MDQLTQYAWIGVLLFSRLGAVLMLAPGWGEQATPTTIRLAAALLATMALAAGLAPSAPPLPGNIAEAVPLIFMEVVTGLILGAGVRLLMSATQVAGAIVGMGTSLSFAQQVDPIVNQQSALFSSFLSLIAVVLVMSIGLHRVMIAAAAESYAVFPPGGLPPLGDVSMFFIDTVSNAFRLGVQIAAPVLVFSIIFNASLGMASRLIPQVQMFLVAMPMTVMLGTAVFALGLGGGLMVWLSAMETQANYFIGGQN